MIPMIPLTGSSLAKLKPTGLDLRMLIGELHCLMVTIDLISSEHPWYEADRAGNAWLDVQDRVGNRGTAGILDRLNPYTSTNAARVIGPPFLISCR